MEKKPRQIYSDKTDVYVGRRFGAVEVISIKDNHAYFLCDCGETFNRRLSLCEARPPMACKECHKREMSVQGVKNHETLVIRDFTPEEEKMMLDFKKKKDAA